MELPIPTTPATENSPVRSGQRWLCRIPLAVVLIFGCHQEGYLHVRGQVLSAADKMPIEGAEVDLNFGSNQQQKEDCAVLRGPNDKVFISDAQGNFDTEARMYPIGCDGCKYGVVCVARAGFQTARIEFNDCQSDWGGGAAKDLAVELVPE